MTHPPYCECRLPHFGECQKEDEKLSVLRDSNNIPIEFFRSNADLSGAELIAAERRRQIEAEGWTPEHDDAHDDMELAEAAFSYVQAYLNIGREQGQDGIPGLWPWHSSWWKPSDDPVRNLVKAGALIAAEIDRLQRTTNGSSA